MVASETERLPSEQGATAGVDSGSDAALGTRIIVIGTTCSGKSTLAEQIAARLGLDFVELDGLYWEPNWKPAERDVFRARIREAIAGERWVIAGNYTSQQQDVSWPRAETVIWIDLPLPLVLQRVVTRSWRRSRSGEALWGGENRERFSEHLRIWRTDESLLSFAVKTHRARRRRFEQALQDPRWAHITFVRLRSRAAVAAWLRDLPAG